MKFQNLILVAALLALICRVTVAATLYVSSGSQIIDQVSSTGVVSAFATLPAGSSPAGLAFDSGGNLYVADYGIDQISKITSGGAVSLFATLPIGSNPSGLAFDSSGNLYVADSGTDRISKINSSGMVSLFATLPAGFPAGLAFDGSGNLYVADNINDQVRRTTSGGAVSSFAALPAGSGPFGLAFDGSGNLYVADSGTDQISKITSGGAVSRFASLPGGSGPYGLAFDAAGNLYSADYNTGNISKISPNGSTVTTFATGLTSPVFIAFGPADPATIGILSQGNASIITGGTSTLRVTVSNLATTGASNLNYTTSAAVQSGSASLGAVSPGSGSLAPGGSNSATVLAASTNLGQNTVRFTASDSQASNSPQIADVTLTVLDHSNASLSASSNQGTQTINFGNVLKGATVPSQTFTIYNRAANTTVAYTANMKLTGFGATGDAALSTNLAAFNGLTPGNGNTFTASFDTSHYTTTGTKTITLGASQLVDDSSLSGAGGNNNGALTVILDGTVGQGTADHSNSRGAFGVPLTATVAQNSTYAGLESGLAADGANGLLGSTATVLDGTASGPASVSMAWRARTTTEKTIADGGLISDVVNVSGLVLSGGGIYHGSLQTDMFVLQMSYDPNSLLSIWGETEAQATANGAVYLGYLDLGADGLIGGSGLNGDHWMRAVDGNFGGTPNFVGNHAYNSGYFVLGDYGVDTSNHVVWAVVDHNSQFGVVPEPSTIYLLLSFAGTGAVAWFVRRRRTTDRQKVRGGGPGRSL